MTDPTTDAVRTELAYKLTELERAISSEDVPQAERLLALLQEQIVPGDSLHSGLELRQRALTALKRRRVRALEEEVKQALATGDIEAGQDALDRLDSLVPGHQNLAHWRERLADLESRNRQQEQLAEFETDLEERWKEAEEAEETQLRGAALIGIYANIYDIARVRADAIGGPLAAGLVQRAADRYNDIRHRHVLASTRQHLGEFRDLLNDLQQLAPDALVVIARNRLRLEETRESVPASEAIKIIEVQARDFAAEKAAEYRDRARKFIDEYALHAARDEIEKALDLFKLDEEERRKTEYLQDTLVTPALKRRETALKLLRQAERQSPFRAWDLIARAQEEDPFVPDLQQVRETFIERVRQELRSRLRSAEQALSGDERPDHVTATRLAQECRAAAEKDEALKPELQQAEQLLVQTEQWRQLEAEIGAAIDDAKEAMVRDPRAAYEGLLARKSSWGDRAKRFGELGQFEAQLAARVDVRVLLTTLQQVLRYTMKKWLGIAVLVIVLVALALSGRWWLPPLLQFLGAHSDLIQGLAAGIQVLLWLGALAAAVLGWRQARKPAPVSATGQDNAVIAQQGAVAAGQLAVGRDVYGNVNFIADPEWLWRAIRQKPPTAELREATKAYLAYLVDRYRYLDLKGMGMSDRVALRLPLAEMYVPLKARIELPERDTWPRRHLRLAGRKLTEEEAEAAGRMLSEPVPVLDLLAKHEGLIILGDPGAGKTTFLKYLCLMLAEGRGAEFGLQTSLPILVPLSAYADALIDGNVPLGRFIADYYDDRGIDLPLEAMLTEALDKGGALLLLDGLDEVREQGRRRLVVERVMDFFSMQRRKGNKLLLTSRIVGYREVRPILEGLGECTLVDFEQEEIELFAEKWTAAIERAARGQTAVAASEAAKERAELLAAIQRNPGVRQLAANPLLLTILALMKRQGLALPERRVELYQKYVDALLGQWNLARGLDRSPDRELDVVETMKVLAPLALWMHETSPGVGLVKQEKVQRELEAIYGSLGLPDPDQAARRFLADVREYAGLLLERGPRAYGFIHLTFQEYLAAVAIARQGQESVEPISRVLEAHVGEDTWREASVLLVSYLGIIQQRERAASEVVRALIQRMPGEPGVATVLAGEAVIDAWPGGVTHDCRQAVIAALLETMRDDGRVAAFHRAAAGRTLARLGDLRPEVLDPLQIEWIEIPAGPFIMGEGKEEHVVELPTYFISRYPITNAQFKVFMEEGGYATAPYWPEAQEAGVWRESEIHARHESVPTPGPEEYGEPYNLPNHPCAGVTWYEALAFTRWLGERTALLVRLPSEAEWEKAARGPAPSRRAYPWGDELDPNKANYDRAGIGATSAVGCFPRGASLAYGVEDMSGNVWEWCSSKYGAYPYASDSREIVDASDEWRVVRGGAFVIADLVRCAARYRHAPNFRSWFYGFRVVFIPFPLNL